MSTTELRPLHDRVIIRRVPEDSTTKGGLFIPETAKEKPARGIVVAAGPGRIDEVGKRIPMGVTEGDEVIFGKYAGTEVTVDDVAHIVLREEEILAVVASRRAD